MKKLILLALLAHSAVAEVIFGGYVPAPIQVNQTFGAVFAFLNSNPSDAHLLSAYQTDIVFSSNLSAQSITELGDFATFGIGLSGYTIDNPNGRISGLIEALAGGGGLYAGNLFQIDFIATQAGPAFIRYDGLLAVDTDFNFIDTTLIPVEFTILPASAEVPETGSLTLVGLGFAVLPSTDGGASGRALDQAPMKSRRLQVIACQQLGDGPRALFGEAFWNEERPPPLGGRLFMGLHIRHYFQINSTATTYSIRFPHKTRHICPQPLPLFS